MTGSRVDLLVTEACTCPGAGPVPPVLVVDSPPLSAGTYEVRLFRLGEGTEPHCTFPPELLYDRDLTIRQGPFNILLEPAVPVAGEPFLVTALASCPIYFPRLFQLSPTTFASRGEQSAIGLPPPCTLEPSYASPLVVEPLAAGDYTLVLLADGFSGGSQLSFSFPFRVEPVSSEELTLRGGRFVLRTSWRTAVGLEGTGRAIGLTADTGAFWFFDPANLELMVKLVDGCGVNSHFWLLAGGLTDVGVTLTVEDTLTGVSRTWSNPVSTPFEPLQDVLAFPCP
ncbi:MAG TPA: hypothetical protein VF017_23380 [Thermoanaerobaculia bacterium]|nr:hypothetical protein [Thermoanaerobaculia bacterium]